VHWCMHCVCVCVCVCDRCSLNNHLEFHVGRSLLQRIMKVILQLIVQTVDVSLEYLLSKN
jgi:hypothetical protein